MVKNSGAAKHQPRCLLSHEFLNKLSVIIGSCELLLEDQGESPNLDAQTARRVGVIRDIARQMAGDLKERACELDGLTKTLLWREAGTKIVVTTPSGAALELGGPALDDERKPAQKLGKGRTSSRASGGVPAQR